MLAVASDRSLSAFASLGAGAATAATRCQTVRVSPSTALANGLRVLLVPDDSKPTRRST